MYESHWQVAEKPFENTSDTRFYYPSETHQGALLKLRYAIENRRGSALLAGATGLGKTLLVNSLRKQLSAECAPVVHLVFPDMPTDQLVAYVAGSFIGETTAGMPTLQQSIRRLQKSLDENAELGQHAVLVIDEAHLLRQSPALDALRLLTNFQHLDQPALTLLLVGQPSLLPTLDRMPDFDSRLGVKCLLRPFSVAESVAYVQHRLTAAAAQQPIFDAEALEAIHYFAQGIPRKINRLCDLALLIGFAEEQTAIGVRQIEAVADELATVSPE